MINYNPLKGFAFFKPDNGGDNIFIPPHLVTAHELQNDMKIQVMTETYIDNRDQTEKIKVQQVFM